jgi:hypothetical protein
MQQTALFEACCLLRVSVILTKPCQKHAAKCQSAEFYQIAARVFSYVWTALRENSVLLSLTFSGFNFQASPLHLAKSEKLSPAKNVLFSYCFFSWQKHCEGSPLVSLQLLEHHAVRAVQQL